MRSSKLRPLFGNLKFNRRKIQNNSAALFLCSFSFITLFSVPLMANTVEVIADRLTGNLSKMGYNNVSLEKCTLAYSWISEGPPQSRSINWVALNRINFESLTPVRKVTRGGRSQYVFFEDVWYPDINTDDRIREFQKWVSSNFPESNWPNSLGPETAAIEKELRKQFTDLNEFSYRIFEFEGKPRTFIQLQFQFSNSNRNLLEAFRSNLILYSRKAGCRP